MVWVLSTPSMSRSFSVTSSFKSSMSLAKTLAMMSSPPVRMVTSRTPSSAFIFLMTSSSGFHPTEML